MKLYYPDYLQTGPVRLFVPYKRKKKEPEAGSPSPSAKKMRAKSSVSASPILKDGSFEGQKTTHTFIILFCMCVIWWWKV